MAITLSILNRFVNFFTAAKSDKFPTKSILAYPPHLKYVAALPWETYNHLHGHILGDIIDTAIDKWRKRLQACVRANGGHFERLL